MCELRNQIKTKADQKTVEELLNDTTKLRAGLSEVRNSQALLAERVNKIDFTNQIEDTEYKLSLLMRQFASLETKVLQMIEEQALEKQYGDVVSAKTHCLACGPRTTTISSNYPNTPGLLGNDNKLYKGDLGHNNPIRPGYPRLSTVVNSTITEEDGINEAKLAYVHPKSAPGGMRKRGSSASPNRTQIRLSKPSNPIARLVGSQDFSKADLMTSSIGSSLNATTSIWEQSTVLKRKYNKETK